MLYTGIYDVLEQRAEKRGGAGALQRPASALGLSRQVRKLTYADVC
jgi:hypothetical protein